MKTNSVTIQKINNGFLVGGDQLTYAKTLEEAFKIIANELLPSRKHTRIEGPNKFYIPLSYDVYIETVEGTEDIVI